MELVLDSNILFAALIKDSLTCELLFENGLKLYAPDFMMDELRKYEELILRKTHRSEGEHIKILHSLKDVIITMPKEEFSEFLEEAKMISPDRFDFMFFALALKLKCGIWSNDKKLKEQNKVNIYSTKDIIELL